MTDEVVIKRYVDAFMAYAKERTGVNKAVDEFGELRKIIAGNPDFKTFLESLNISNHEKYPLIDKILAADFSAEMRSFLKLVLEKGRINRFIDMAEYAKANYGHGAETEAVLKTCHPLDEPLPERIRAALEKRLNKKLRLRMELDAGLVGGVRAEIGNIIIDGSIKRRLEDMKERLLALKTV